MYLIFYCRGAIPLNCHSPTSHPSTFLQDFSSEFLDVWALFHNVFIITYTSQTHFVIPPPSSSGSGKREKERASAAVAVSSHPFPLVIFTPPSLQKRRLAHLFFFFSKISSNGCLSPKMFSSVENPLGYTITAILSILGSRKFSLPLNTIEATQHVRPITNTSIRNVGKPQWLKLPGTRQTCFLRSRQEESRPGHSLAWEPFRMSWFRSSSNPRLTLLVSINKPSWPTSLVFLLWKCQVSRSLLIKMKMIMLPVMLWHCIYLHTHLPPCTPARVCV